MERRTRFSAIIGDRVDRAVKTGLSGALYDKIELPISTNQKQAQELIP